MKRIWDMATALLVAFAYAVGVVAFGGALLYASEQYKKHEEMERGKRNTAKYFTLVFTPCAGVCTVQAFLLGQEKMEDPAHRECVTDVQFAPMSADTVLITFTNQIGVHTAEKAALVPEPMAIHGGTYTDSN